MKTLILEGRQIYEDGQLKGPLQLEEGQRAGPFIIIESCSFPLKVVEPTEEELKETILNETKEGHLLTLEGRFQMADTENANGRIYPKAIWDKVFESGDFLKSVDRGEVLGESDHPKDGETRLQRVAGKVTKLWKNPDNHNEVMGRFAIFNNENGKNLKAIHEGGGRLGVSSRGKGSVVRLNGKDVVQEDYALQTWDVVHGPSTPGAYPEEVTEAGKGSVAMKKDSKGATESVDLIEVNGKKYKLVEAEPIMEPGFVKTAADEEKWKKAKDAAGSEGGEPKYALSNHIFHKMKGEAEECPKMNEAAGKTAEEDWGKSWIGKTYANNKKLRDAFMTGWNDVKDGKWVDPPKELGAGSPAWLSHSLGQQYKMGKVKESKDNPTTPEELKAAMKLLDPAPVKDVQEALKSLRSLYRETFHIEGPLAKHEIDGINEVAKELIKMAEKLDEACPIIRAWVGNNLVEDVQDVIEARTEGELRRKIKEIVDKSDGPVIINIDRSEKVFAESAKRFSGLLEAQTLKAEQAVREKAETQATISELSAKLAGAKKLIEAFAVRCKRLDESKKSALADVDAACKILDEMSKEVKAEGIKGAAAVIAASNPSSKNLGEALVSIGSIEEAISLVRKVKKNDLPKIEREPTHELKVEEAIQKDQDYQKKILTESKENNPKDAEARRDQNLMTAVVNKVKARGGR
jgi:hypothetical protein